ncbi:hypothetical protein D3C72_1956600 [compost metagenome]
MAFRLGSLGCRRNTPVPPMPSSGLTMTSWCLSWNALRRAMLRVTSVGAVNSLISVIASFSGWFRMAAPPLNTQAPCASAYSSRCVEYTYSMSNGGSLRITTAPKSASGRSRAADSRHQSWPCRSASATSSIGVVVALTVPASI